MRFDVSLYRYQAAAASGELVNGEMEAIDQDTVIERLHDFPIQHVFDYLQIHHHPRHSIRFALQRHFRHIVVPMPMRIRRRPVHRFIFGIGPFRISAEMRRRKFNLASNEHPNRFDVETAESDTLKYNDAVMNRSKLDRILQAGILVLTTGLILVLYSSIHEKLVNVGDSAPNFTITAENGKPVSLSNFGGKVLVLNFWATWCPPCVEEMPSLNKFAADFKDKGVVVLGVSVDKDATAYKNFIRNLDPAFLTARDPDMKINLEYGTVQYPETYIIDSHGKVVNKIISSANWTDDKMVSYVQSLL